MPDSDLRGRIAIIVRYSRKGFNFEALRLFRQLQNEGLPPNCFVIPSVLRCASNLCDSSAGRSLHGFAIRSILASDPFISSALIGFYSKHGRVDDARRIFDRAPDKDLVVWNSMISEYACCGLFEEGMSLLREMRSCGPRPDLLTWNSLISGFAQYGYEKKASDLLGSMRSAGIEPDVFSWTSLISGSVRNFNYREAFDLFRQMVAVAGVWPNAATISSLLPASTNMMDLRRGREIHGFSVVSSVERDLYVSSSLIDMYSKCGLLSDAKQIFEGMPSRNTISWNSMIFAYANHGRCDKAVELFYQMEIHGAMPDHLTFTAVLTACSHAGMVQVGNHLFQFMQEGCRIAPRLEHYACMVDLLGRAGNLFEAYDLIRGMPIEPDCFVWGALLGACRLHSDIRLSEIAERHLQELEPKSMKNCFLPSGAHVNPERSGDAEETTKQPLERKKKRKSRAYVGCSWTTQAPSLKVGE